MYSLLPLFACTDAVRSSDRLPHPLSPPPQPTPEPEKMDATTEQKDVEELPPAVDDAEPPKVDESPIPVESEPVEPPVVAEPEQDPAEKKRVQDQLRQESRKRGNRMFGMMLGTLKRAKEQVDTSVESDSMKKRLELEKKLKDKLDGEKKILQLRSEREREVRDLKANIQNREEEIGSADAIVSVLSLNPILKRAHFGFPTSTVPSSTRCEIQSRWIPLYLIPSTFSGFHDRRHLCSLQSATSPLDASHHSYLFVKSTDLLPPLSTPTFAGRPYRGSNRCRQEGDEARSG